MGKVKGRTIKSATKGKQASNNEEKIVWPSDLDYISLFNNCVIAPIHLGEVDKIIDERIMVNKDRYERVALSASRKISITDTRPLRWLSAYEPGIFGVNARPFYVPVLLRDIRVNLPGSQFDGIVASDHSGPGLMLGNGEPPVSLLGTGSRDWLSNDFRFTPLGGRFIPWYIVGVIHNMEGNCNFKVHLHNGDPLTGYTTHFPAGHPKVGHPPPFTWEESAIESLTVVRHFDDILHWNLPVVLRTIETYNGKAYMNMHRYSPYLWSYSNFFSKGKYIRDRVYDPNAGSKQAGAAVVLKRMEQRGLIYIPRW